jgi:hypothetical protein
MSYPISTYDPTTDELRPADPDIHETETPTLRELMTPKIPKPIGWNHPLKNWWNKKIKSLTFIEFGK